MNLQVEFDRQVTTLIQKGYPEAAGKTNEEFLKLIQPLREKATKILSLEIDLKEGRLPFVIVVTSDVAPAEKSMTMIEREGKKGVVRTYPRQPEDFTPISSVKIPNTPAYLLVNIDRGKETRNIRPNQALPMIQKKNRSPLTIDEGIAVVTHFPEFLLKNNCFSLLASRYPGDKKVPAIWINAQKNPNLGWCWDGNPHTWLGSASCRNRVF